MWRRIGNLIRQLPQASRFAQAVANDEEHVEAILAAQEGQPETEFAPPLSEWDTKAALLAEIVDELRVLRGVSIAAAGGKPGKMKPTSRPTTAHAAVKQRKLETSHRKVLDRVAEARRRAGVK